MALAPNALFRDTMTMLEPPQNRLSPSQIWPMENPVGTEQLRPQYLTAPDADVVPGVMWGDRMYSPRVAGGLNSAMEIGMGFAGSTGPGGIKAYHGSPHSFDRFDTSRIGTGEGAQAYGHGLYFAEREGVAKGYRDALAPGSNLHDLHAKHGGNADAMLTDILNTAQSGPSTADYDALLRYRKTGELPPRGSMYEVEIKADPERFLHWDKPLSEQPPAVLEALEKTGQMDYARDYFAKNARTYPNPTGEDLHDFLNLSQGRRRAGAEVLQEAGIPGIRYLDAGSRRWPAQYQADLRAAQEQVADLNGALQTVQNSMQDVAPGSRAHNMLSVDLLNHKSNLETAQGRLDALLQNPVEGSHNLVVFDDATIEILRKYGLAGLMLGGGAAAGSQGQ